MNLLHVETWSRRDDRACRNRFGTGVGGVPPELVQPREEHGIFVGAREEVGLAIGSWAVIPLVKAVDGNDAGSSGEGVAKGRFLGDALGAGVEESITERGVFRPTRYESPAIRVHHASLVVFAH